MQADQATRIKYASKYARSSNYWKNSIGMNKALVKLDVLGAKRAEEQAFNQWVAQGGKATKVYQGLLSEMEQAYKGQAALMRDYTYLTEAYSGMEAAALAYGLKDIRYKDMAENGAKIKAGIEDVYKNYVPSLDERVLPAMLDILRQRVSSERVAALFAQIDRDYKGDTKAYAKALFAKSIVPYKDKVLAAIEREDFSHVLAEDPAYKLALSLREIILPLGKELNRYDEAISRGNRLYFAGRQQMNPSKPMPSDANSTMRLSYGSIKPYSPADATEYDYFTTPRGILEKNADAANPDYVVADSFLDLLKKKDWGRWADKSGELHVNFISNNDITGGNSGSPVFDKNGRVFGLAFDGNWDAMSGDIEFEPQLQRTIVVDIRYVLFTIDKWGKCPRLIQELSLR